MTSAPGQIGVSVCMKYMFLVPVFLKQKSQMGGCHGESVGYISGFLLKRAGKAYFWILL